MDLEKELLGQVADDSDDSGEPGREACEPDDEFAGVPADEPQSVDEILEEVSAAAEISELRQELEASKDRYLRLMAEFDNYKRRSGREYERLIESANEKLILELVDVRENLERALKAGEAGGGDFPVFFDGMKMIFSKFEEVLCRNGLSVFAQAGEEFDPMIHDALMNTPHAQIPANHIAEVFERGYRLKDKVIKHARVIVSSGAPAVEEPPPADGQPAGDNQPRGDAPDAGQPAAEPPAGAQNGGE